MGPGSLWLTSGAAGVAQAPGTRLSAARLCVRGAGVFDLSQPGNDFGTVAVQVAGNVAIRDANDLRIGQAGPVRGISAWGGNVDITTPDGYIYAVGLFGARSFVQGYHSIGDVEVAETSVGSGTYRIQITNGTDSRPPVRTPADIEAFLGLTGGVLAGLDPNTTEGSAVRIDFDPKLAGDMVAYGWNFKTREAFDTAFGMNDYSFASLTPVAVVRVVPAGGIPLRAAAPPADAVAAPIADVEDVAASAKQDAGLFSWQTGVAETAVELNHTDAYRVGFGAMDVNHTLHMSGLYLMDIRYEGSIPPPVSLTGFLDRIYDHVEDFAHLRPDPRIPNIGPGPLGPTLDEVSTYFDQACQATDHRYWFQTVGSIYQIPR